MFLLVTPARDERDNIAGLVETVRASTLRPDRWIVVDDGSGDGTGDALREAGADLPFLEVVRLEGRAGYMGFHYADVVAAGVEAAGADVDRIALFGILDADIRVSARYWEALASALAAEPRLGIASGALASRDDTGRVVLEPNQRRHLPRGGLRLVDGDCFREVGRVVHSRAPDSVMVARARASGWSTALFEGLVALSTRPTDSRGDVAGFESRGRRAWNVGQPAWQVGVRAVGMAAAGRPAEGRGLLRGYRSERKEGGEQVPGEAIRLYYRRERPREWASSLRARAFGTEDPYGPVPTRVLEPAELRVPGFPG